MGLLQWEFISIVKGVFINIFKFIFITLLGNNMCVLERTQNIRYAS